MTLHLHHLTGCAPTPLAHYLKALGILRIVAEQRDPSARGFWQDEHFCLLTTLDQSALEQFFLDDYAPTPMFNPWGARSGFYPGSSETTARKALEKIERSAVPRLASFRCAISGVRSAVARAGGEKPDTDEGEVALVDQLKRTVRSGGEQWLGVVVASVGDEYRKPALLGTGGNEGSGSYVSAYLSAVTRCIVDRQADHALPLFALDGRRGCSWTDGSFGQFLPEGEASAWDMVLLMEGAVLLRSSATSRSASNSAPRFLSSPFYFAPHAMGAGTSATLDEFSVQKGRPMPGRGEQWFPLWSAPARLEEVATLFSEARCRTGRTQAERPVDVARAIARLGVSRGVEAFVRYGYLQRNNLATHYAVPLGRVRVRTNSHASLVDDRVARWMRTLRFRARDKNAPARLAQAERRLADAVFVALTHDSAASNWQAVLQAAVDIETIQATGTAYKAGPIPSLSPEWLEAADDGSSEWRLACALGSASAYRDHKTRRSIDPVRHHWLPLQPGAFRFAESDKRLARDTRVVMKGRDAIADLNALVQRRAIEAAQNGKRTLRLEAAFGYEADPRDLAALIAGDVNLDAVLSLARALMAVRWDGMRSKRRRDVAGRDSRWPDEAWMALRLASLPWPLEDGRRVPTDAAMLRRLESGDGTGAVDVALRRLRSAGFRAPLIAAVADESTARLWGASLAFPISRKTATRLAQQFEFRSKKEKER